MPVPRPELTLDEVREAIADRCLRPAAADDLVGIESERLVLGVDDPRSRVGCDVLERVLAPLAPLPHGSRITLEPGGQVELSSATWPGPEAACEAVAEDWKVVEQALAGLGLAAHAVGVDPLRGPVRIVDSPRYRAMEEFFDADGSAGRWMMGATASVQVNLGLGEGDARWRALHEAGPALVAMFANSPLAGGRPTGWKSWRWAIWQAIDPSRTAPPLLASLDAWVDYALCARTMLIRKDDDHYEVVDRRLRFVDWVTGGHDLGWPTDDDVAYHLTTLFPPIRPRGWLEVRFLDALPDPWWRVPALVVCALAAEPEATVKAVAGTGHLWSEAGRHGLGGTDLAAAATACLTIAAESLTGDAAAVVAAYRERFVDRGRSPADETLDEWRGRHRALIAARPTTPGSTDPGRTSS